MKNWKYPYKILFLLLVIYIAGCSVNKKYSNAYSFYMRSNYVAAIILYDDFIEKYPVDALATKADLERSDCYYQLGYQAYLKNNWILASRLYYLSNSDIADKMLDNCYFELTKISLANNDTVKTLKYYDHITSYLKDSELIQEVLFNRIKINIDLGNKFTAFDDYHFLWSNYPQNEFTKKVQPSIDELIPFYINEAIVYKDSAKYNESLELLFKLSQYPTKFQESIQKDISNLYLLLAEEAIVEKDYQQAKNYFTKVIEYDLEKISFVDQEMDDICMSIIQKGNNLIHEYKFNEAIKVFETCFLLIPEYQTSIRSIENAEGLKIKHQKAIDLKNNGLNFEKEKEYKKALYAYKQSYSNLKTPEVREKISLMNNMIAAKKDPKAFAKSIIFNYKKGMIPDKVSAIEIEMEIKYGENIKASGWRVLYAVGEYKYEVRYDILTPKENYYFAWRVNLKNKEITPSNKVSEEILKN